MKTKIKLNDNVVVISGIRSGKKGKVLHINAKKGLVVVEGINKRTKFVRPNQENPNGSSVNKEFPIHLSNIMYFCDKCKKGVRIKNNIAADKAKSRVCSKCGKSID
ncbi:MAG: 50S ribosomal protein L24 [Spirochaetia bacterium]|jgi:large subunit ribosomal protein L24|nr:50S ribosomal protein L24 [Spirochaetia bacterium]